MNGSKPFNQSLTIQALLVGLIFTLTQSFGLDFDKGYLTELIQSIIQVIALLIAGYGRIRATKIIK